MLEIIFLGYIVNIGVSVLFILFMSVHTIIEVNNDPKRMIELDQTKRDIQELKNLLIKAPFQERYMDIISFLLPFAAIPRYYMIIKSINKYNSVSGHIRSEIQRINKMIKDNR